jgi:GTP-binding protein
VNDVRVSTAEFAAGAARKDQVPATSHFEDAPEIAFAGRSNVGKSSLLNMLLSRRGLARTSNTPGCTRQINFFDVTLARTESPHRVVFVDLPGYGYAKVSKTEGRAWKDLLEGYLSLRPTLRAVVLLVDVRRGLEQEEEDLIEFLAQRQELELVVVATKVDKLSRAAQKPALAKLSRPRPSDERRAATRSVVVATSAETGYGRDQLWARILDACRVR